MSFSMPTYYRMMSEKYRGEPFGSSPYGGRWNPKGYPMIYTASSAALAALEYLCIKGTSAALEIWYVVVYQSDDINLIGELEKQSLPPNWDMLPHGMSTQDFGKLWLMENSFPFLKVPSARLPISFYPEEYNLLVNPGFQGIQNLFRVVDVRKFVYKIKNEG